MNQKYEKLKTLLKELFQLDQPDLDFGIYRVLHARAAEVSQFLDEDLLPQVREAFRQYRSADKVEIENDLATAIEQATGLGVDPEATKRVKELRARLKSDAVDIGALESEVYDHLFGFFRRYYSEGDYLAKRVYKPGVYAIPYEGEEVTLHWANKDQYYIKTSEYLRDYAFRLRPWDEAKPMRVHFRLVDATEGEHGNVKASEGKKRVFVLAAPGESGRDFIAIQDGKQGKELTIRFEYRPATLNDWPDDERHGKRKPPVQEQLSAAASTRILGVADPGVAEFRAELEKPHLLASAEQAGYNRLAAHLKRYTGRNTFDYFIHKNLKSFLHRELDFYIKNEVMHLDDVEHDTAPRVDQYLSKIKVIRKVADKIIVFLAQLEEFQKKLWLKKKFVIETQYCITVRNIPESFYAEIVANQAQCQEWVRLLAIDQIAGDLIVPGYSKELTPEFLRENQTLVVDTRHFDTRFTMRLLAAIDNLDERVDGVLFHADNFQAICTMRGKYDDRLNYVYLDPPFNTTDVGFAYKNEYRHSSWLTMVIQTLDRTVPLMRRDGLISIAIDDEEIFNLGSAIDELIPGRRVGILIVEIKPSGRTNDKFLSTSHEYYLWYCKDPTEATICFFDLPPKAKGAYLEVDAIGNYKWRDFLRTGGYSTPAERPNSFYRIYYRDTDGYVGTQPVEGAIAILPLDGLGERRVWRKTQPSFLRHVEAGDIKIEPGRGGIMKVRIKDRIKEGIRPKSVWIGSKYDASSHGTKLLQKIFGKKRSFPYPKSLSAVFDAVLVAARHSSEARILDYFAGSGTTGHAVINLNRADGGGRKFVLVEMGESFDTVLLPRIKKITFTPDWKDGAPERLATAEEADRSPRVVKVIRLESYEDTLNNLEADRSQKQQLLLDAAEAQGADGLKERYILRYMLDVETRGSRSLLDVDGFADPTAYRLRVKRPGSDESREVNVDLLETFNWLIGLTVRHIAAPQSFGAAFERDDERRLRLKGRLRPDAEGPYWFRTVTGTTPDGRRTLIIWRKLTGEPEQDNLVLDDWFTRQGYSAKDSEFDLIYVNGGNNLENLKTPDDLWKVRLIEDDFHRLMFDQEEG